ncbi:hypothetical protein OYC64_013587 [Pagothenia borchgrevinki]|uniref:Uncharacterized protein n=1 Tax=Pagothenia borchgrevinki TaxID=8213 RepID=A0ABD2FU77_PAGBO
MDSPVLEHRPCPSCTGLIAGADPHHLCFECLGPEHAADGLAQSPSCHACRMLPRLGRRHRLEHFHEYYVSPEEEEDHVDLEVVEMGEQEADEEEVPFVFAIPAGRPRSSRGKTTRVPRCRGLPVPSSMKGRRTGQFVRTSRR